MISVPGSSCDATIWGSPARRPFGSGTKAPAVQVERLSPEERSTPLR
ncbi:hypothetical protein [Streptomyces sp. IBTA2]|nr:hypothetical protein [Streptomyces sp. IBTA2]